MSIRIPPGARGIRLLVDVSTGWEMSRLFANIARHEGWGGIDPDDLDTIGLPVPDKDDDDAWWERDCAWHRVRDGAVLVDGAGDYWVLHHDGALYAVCWELISDGEHRALWGTGKPAGPGLRWLAERTAEWGHLAPEQPVTVPASELNLMLDMVRTAWPALAAYLGHEPRDRR